MVGVPVVELKIMEDGLAAGMPIEELRTGVRGCLAGLQPSITHIAACIMGELLPLSGVEQANRFHYEIEK